MTQRWAVCCCGGETRAPAWDTAAGSRVYGPEQGRIGSHRRSQLDWNLETGTIKRRDEQKRVEEEPGRNQQAPGEKVKRCLSCSHKGGETGRDGKPGWVAELARRAPDAPECEWRWLRVLVQLTSYVESSQFPQFLLGFSPRPGIFLTFRTFSMLPEAHHLFLLKLNCQYSRL